MDKSAVPLSSLNSEQISYELSRCGFEEFAKFAFDNGVDGKLIEIFSERFANLDFMSEKMTSLERQNLLSCLQYWRNHGVLQLIPMKFKNIAESPQVWQPSDLMKLLFNFYSCRCRT